MLAPLSCILYLHLLLCGEHFHLVTLLALLLKIQELVTKWYAQHIFLLFFWLAMANSAVNPIIYFLMDAKLVEYQIMFLSVLDYPQV